jgi:hypothetical protein
VGADRCECVRYVAVIGFLCSRSLKGVSLCKCNSVIKDAQLRGNPHGAKRRMDNRWLHDASRMVEVRGVVNSKLKCTVQA